MKISLINPPVNFDISLGRLKKIASQTKMIPLGIAYIASNAVKAGHTVEIVDAYAENLTMEETLDRVRKMRPDIVGISSVTPTVPFMLSVAEKIKACSDKKTLIVAGGPHPTIFPDAILAHDAIDVVVRNEGEDSFRELADTHAGNRDFENIKGISYKNKGSVVHNENRPYISDLDKISPPAYELLPMELYSAPPHWLVAEPAYQIITSRGCPFRCTFCGIKTLGKALRSRSVSGVISEIDFLYSNYGAREIMFVDATFPLNKNYGMEFCREFIKSGMNKKIRWVTETRVDIADEALLKQMYEAGCRVICYGIESGSEKMLKAIKKNITLLQARDAIRLAKRAGLEVCASFIIGLPGESEHDMRQTIDFIKSVDIDYPKINLLVPYPGSEIYETVIKERPYISEEWDRYTSFSSMTDGEPIYVPDGISAEDLKSLHKKAYREIYFRLKFIMNHIGKLNSFMNVKKYFTVLEAFIRGVL